MSRPLALLLAAYLALGVVYSITTPLFETPDEQWHFAFVQHVAQGKGLPVQAVPLQHLAEQEGSQPPLYYLLAAGLTFWVDTSDYPAIAWANPHYGFDVPGVVNDNKNLFIHTTQENFPYRNTPLAMHLARWLSLLLGAVAVYFTYRMTAMLTAGNIWIPFTAAALVAFNPQFLYITTAVSNDSTIVALAALGLFLLVRAFRTAPTPRDAVLLGIMCGLAALAKVTGLAMLPLVVITLAYLHRRHVRTLIVQTAVVGAAFALTGGWWYVRNLVLYGEFTGTARMVEIFGGRTAGFTLDAWLAQANEMFQTFWLGFGWGNVRAPEWLYTAFAIALLLGLLGLAIGIWHARARFLEALRQHAPLLVLAGWIGIVALALLRWMIQTEAPYGRLLFPAFPALAPLIVIGWMQLSPPKLKAWILRLVPLALVLLALAAPFLFIVPAYARPETLSESDVSSIPARVDIRYGDALMLLGSRVALYPVDPHGALRVDLYWRVLGKMETDYSLNLSALDENYRVVGTRNTYPGHGTLPTTLMVSGQILHDTYWLPARAAKGSVQVSVFERASQQNLTPFDPAGNEITPIVNTFSLAP